MNISKVQDAIAELDGEAARCKRLADELRDVVKRYSNGSGHVAADADPAERKFKLNLKNRPEGEDKSVRTLALELLKGQETHVNDLVVQINARRKEPTNRAAVESQLVRALKNPKFGLKRTAPGTFVVHG